MTRVQEGAAPVRGTDPLRRSGHFPLDTVLMLALTFSTGIVDAVGFIAFDQIFAANMTGNLVVMGIGIVGAAPGTFWGPLCAVVSFALGAFSAGMLLNQRLAGWTGRSAVAFAATALLLVAVAVWELSGVSAVGELRHITAAGALGFAMGVQTAAARRIGVAEVNTVVVTITLAGLVMEVPGAHRPVPRMQLRRAGAVILLALGAACGALISAWGSGMGLLVAAGVILLVAAAGQCTHVARRQMRPPSADR